MLSVSRFGRKIIAPLVAVVGLAAFTPAHAGVVPPALQISLAVNDGQAQVFTPTGQNTGGNQWMWDPSYSTPDWEMQCNITADTDPWVNSVIGFTNNTGVDNLYTIIVTMPIAAIPGGTLMGGSVGGSVTWNGAGGTGGEITYGTGLPGSALYNGQIDLANVLPLLPPDGTPPDVAAPFPGGTSNIPATNAGLPGPTIAGPAVVGSIGIQLQFILSAGDSVAITSYFEVQPVPAPAALALLGLAGLGARRRRD